MSEEQNKPASVPPQEQKPSSPRLPEKLPPVPTPDYDFGDSVKSNFPQPTTKQEE